MAGDAKNSEVLFDVETIQSEWSDVINVNSLRNKVSTTPFTVNRVELVYFVSKSACSSVSPNSILPSSG